MRRSVFIIGCLIANVQSLSSGGEPARHQNSVQAVRPVNARVTGARIDVPLVPPLPTPAPAPDVPDHESVDDAPRPTQPRPTQQRPTQPRPTQPRLSQEQASTLAIQWLRQSEQEFAQVTKIPNDFPDEHWWPEMIRAYVDAASAKPALTVSTI